MLLNVKDPFSMMFSIHPLLWKISFLLATYEISIMSKPSNTIAKRLKITALKATNMLHIIELLAHLFQQLLLHLLRFRFSGVGLPDPA